MYTNDSRVDAIGAIRPRGKTNHKQ